MVSVQPCSKAEAYGGTEPFGYELAQHVAGHYVRGQAHANRLESS